MNKLTILHLDPSSQRHGWNLSDQASSWVLQRTKPAQGWFCLTVNITAVKLPHSKKPTICILFDGFEEPVQLLHLPDGSQQLIFRHKTLTSIQFILPGSACIATRIELKIKSIFSGQAVIGMLCQVSAKAKQQAEDAMAIYHLSLARFRRAGWSVLIEKLIQSYQPQLRQQWLGIAPYPQWIARTETFTYDRCEAIGNIGLLNIILRQDQSGLWLQSHQSILAQTSAQFAAGLIPHSAERPPIANTAIVATQFYLWLPAGDMLHPCAVNTIQRAIKERPDLTLFYMDHDWLDAQLKRHQPHFKPSWSPEALLEHNYIGSAYWVRGDLLLKLGYQTWQQAIEFWHQSAHWQLLTLGRQLDFFANGVVGHTPVLQYHQFVPFNPDSSGCLNRLEIRESYNKTASHSADQLPIIQNAIHLLQINSNNNLQMIANSEASPLFNLKLRQPDRYQLTYFLQHLPSVSLLIPTRDQLQLTRSCVESILTLTDYANYEIVILNNQSKEAETLCWFAEISLHPQVRVLNYDYSFNYSAINNYGVENCTATLIGLVNNDTQVINRDWLFNMVQYAQQPYIGCVGAKLYYDDDSIQHAGVILGLYGLAGHSHKHFPREAAGYCGRLLTVQNYSAVTAACLVMRRSLYLQVGGLNEQHLPIAFNDVDLCLKVQQAGFRNLWTPDAELYHYESKSRGKENTPQKQARAQGEIAYMQQSWPTQIANDCFYHPQLTRKTESFCIVFGDEIPVQSNYLVH